MWLGFFVSFFVSIACILLTKKCCIGLDSRQNNKPQRLHTSNTSRLGGVGIFFGFLVVFLLNIPFSLQNVLIFLGLFIVFLAGVLEDVLDTLKPKTRLFIQLFGIILMLSSQQGLIQDLSPVVVLPWYMGVLFSLFGIVGVCNAVNIIDGLNGLASGIALIVFGAIAFVAFERELDFVFSLAVFAIVGILGFFVLNFPTGKIFLGDGGAYFLGVLLAFLLGILSNNGVSAWFGLCVMIYPVWEVVFSIIRRKANGKKAMQPDGLHLHSLIFKITGNNALSAFIILIFYLFYVFLLLVCVETSVGFIYLSLLFCVAYIVVYYFLLKKVRIKS